MAIDLITGRSNTFSNSYDVYKTIVNLLQSYTQSDHAITTYTLEADVHFVEDTHLDFAVIYLKKNGQNVLYISREDGGTLNKKNVLVICKVEINSALSNDIIVYK